jgi:hypothetical protein
MICISAPPAALDRYPRGIAGHVADSRSPDPLGRIPTDQCSPFAGFPARRIHPIRSIQIVKIQKTL